MLAKQIEQRRLQCGDGMHGDTQVEGLQAAACRVAVGERLPGAVEHAVVVADGVPEHQGSRIFKGLTNGFAARHFAHADMAGAVPENQDVAGKPGTVGTAQVEQHAVLPGDRNHLQVGNHRGALMYRVAHTHPSILFLCLCRCSQVGRLDLATALIRRRWFSPWCRTPGHSAPAPAGRMTNLCGHRTARGNRRPRSAG